MAPPKPTVGVIRTQPQVAPKVSRMTLGSLVKGKIKQPIKVLLFGPEGIGKSTFGSDAPSPIFIGAENGTEQLDVVRFQSPENWAEVIEAVRTLTNDEHEFKSLVIDTLDWIEPMLWAHVCQRDNEPNIEAYGYGKGYQVALDEWRVLLAALERLRVAKGMNIVFLAHSWIRPFKNPEGEDYDRYELKLHNKAAGLIKEWVDAVLFANYETFANKERGKRTKGIDTGARLIHTQRRAAFDAKNRHNLSDTLPLSWAEFDKAVNPEKPGDCVELMSEIQRKAKLLGGQEEKDAMGYLAKAGTDNLKLAKLNDWANAKLIKKGIEQ